MKIILPDGVLKGHFRIPSSSIQLIGNGLNTILTNDDDKPTVQIESFDGTVVKGCIVNDLVIRHTGDGGGLLVAGRENSFTNIKLDECTEFGLKFKNTSSGTSLNKFVNCIFYRNRGEGGVIIPANDENGYSNGNLFTNCNFDRFWYSVAPLPTIDCATSVTIIGGWLQAKNLSGLRVRGSGAVVRLIGLRVDSTSATDILIEFTDGATIANIQSNGSDIDGLYSLDGETKHANTLNGNFSNRVINGKVVKQFKDAQHDSVELGGNGGDGVKVGNFRIFWGSGDPTTARPDRYHFRGDISIRSNASGSTEQIYICTASGTPGTWQGFGRAASAQADSTATDVATLKNDFNTLLAKLRSAKLMNL